MIWVSESSLASAIANRGSSLSDGAGIAIHRMEAALALIMPRIESSKAIHLWGATPNFSAVCRYTAGWGFPNASYWAELTTSKAFSKPSLCSTDSTRRMGDDVAKAKGNCSRRQSCTASTAPCNGCPQVATSSLTRLIILSATTV